MGLDKKEVVVGLCQTVRRVGEHFENRYAHDCFCEQSLQRDTILGFQFDDQVMKFIRDAVDEKIAREK